MLETIDELTAEIRRVIPQSNTIKQFIPDGAGAYVTFRWNGRDFLVKRNFESYETKADKLFVTGSSMLMQMALSSRMKNEKVIEACIETIKQAEAMLDNKRQTEQGLKLVGAVKAAISKMAGRKNSSTRVGA